ncbi:IS3 family transposase [Ureibacillus terrenus]
MYLSTLSVFTTTYIECFYNYKRIHSDNRYPSPVMYEKAY